MIVRGMFRYVFLRPPLFSASIVILSTTTAQLWIVAPISAAFTAQTGGKIGGALLGFLGGSVSSVFLTLGSRLTADGS